MRLQLFVAVELLFEFSQPADQLGMVFFPLALEAQVEVADRGGECEMPAMQRAFSFGVTLSLEVQPFLLVEVMLRPACLNRSFFDG